MHKHIVSRCSGLLCAFCSSCSDLVAMNGSLYLTLSAYLYAQGRKAFLQAEQCGFFSSHFHLN